MTGKNLMMKSKTLLNSNLSPSFNDSFMLKSTSRKINLNSSNLKSSKKPIKWKISTMSYSLETEKSQKSFFKTILTELVTLKKLLLFPFTLKPSHNKLE